MIVTTGGLYALMFYFEIYAFLFWFKYTRSVYTLYDHNKQYSLVVFRCSCVSFPESLYTANYNVPGSVYDYARNITPLILRAVTIIPFCNFKILSLLPLAALLNKLLKNLLINFIKYFI